MRLCRRFPAVARELAHRHGGRPPLTITDEHDAQDLFRALLRLEFDDIRAESWNPTFLGGGSRVDVLLPAVGIAVELKMTRDSLVDRQLGDELAEDITRYGDEFANRGARILVCFVYDPHGLLRNPAGLVRDLESASTERLQVIGVVA